ncbi:MAG: hypothetical protein HZC38_09585 [Chloroflexi bacterium]|nr:hypothetical protein [Chloroflexota bacterium]
MNRRLSRQEYFQAIAHADYVVFPRGNETAYRASAVLIDAITLETPVLAPDEGHFREMVSRDGLMKGGWLYNHQDDLSATMLSLAKTSPSEYASMCRHVASIKQEISIENASMSLQSILGV